MKAAQSMGRVQLNSPGTVLIVQSDEDRPKYDAATVNTCFVRALCGISGKFQLCNYSSTIHRICL